MMSLKLGTLGLLEIKVFWDRCFDVIVFAHEEQNVKNKTLSREADYVVDAVVRPKFGNSGFLWEKLS